MIERLNLLRNVGQFESINPGAQLPFARLTLIYAENGRGKTTLSAVFRSLSSNEPALIQERHRLGATHTPHVVFQAVGGAIHTFQNNAWSAPLPAIATFDDAFVAQNVCSGLEIAAGHRQNLHELILGAQGVTLNATLQARVEEIEAHNRRLREKGDAIPGEARGNLSVDQFCALANRPDLDDAIRDCERRVAAAQSAALIQQRPVFAPLSLPFFDVAEINQILERSLRELDAEAARQVQTHLTRLGQSGEQWVSTGVGMVQAASQGQPGEACPFCIQPLAGSEIIDHYRAYFGEAYSQLKHAIMETRRSIGAAHGGEITTSFERSVRMALETRLFWSRFAEIPDVTIDTAALVRAWQVAREAVDAAFAKKQQSPLEPIRLDAVSIAAIDAFHVARDEVTELSLRLLASNAQLVVVKEQAQASNIATLQGDLATLRATRARYLPEVAPLCQSYLDEKQAKAATETLRNAARADLDNYRQNIFPYYQNAINAYLQRFNAGFRLHGMTSVNNRGGSAVNYAVVINQNQVPLTADGGPCFRSALSSGDRNTLALAFFFASLDQDPTLANRIVVIDDPMTSLDEHRSLVTVQEILRLVNRVSQVIVLSHSKPFLLGLWREAPRNVALGRRLSRAGNASTFDSWDVTADCITEHDRRYERVTNYIQAANPAEERTVAADLRHLLEAFVRVAYPDVFTPGSLLGEFINTCRQRLNGPQQLLDADDVQELREILTYANLFHHETNQNFQTEVINDGQLATFAQRTVAFIRR